jgi:hypothetical protein
MFVIAIWSFLGLPVKYLWQQWKTVTKVNSYKNLLIVCHNIQKDCHNTVKGCRNTVKIFYNTVKIVAEID